VAVLWGCCPRGEEVEGVRGRGARLGGVQVVQALLEGVAAGLRAEDCDSGVGGFVPVGVETMGVVVEEGVASEVGLTAQVVVVER
jgi:hypothetical protein